MQVQRKLTDYEIASEHRYTKRSSAFDLDEYSSRLHRIKSAMAAAGIDVLVLPDPANIFYATGYEIPSYYTPQCAVIALDREEPLLFLREMDVRLGRFCIFMADASVVGFPERYIGGNRLHPMDFIASEIDARGWGRLHVGVPKNTFYFTIEAHERLCGALPDATFVDPGRLMDRIRSIKSEQEVFYMRRAGTIVQKAMETVIKALEPGMRECDAMALAFDTAIRGTPEFCGGIPTEPVIARGANAASAQSFYTEEIFRRGEVANLELVGSHRHYHVPLARTVYLGKPSRRFLATASCMLEAFEAALCTMRPGVLCEEVEAACQAVLRNGGHGKESRVGYSIGAGFPPDWGEAGASLQPGDKTVLQPNMIFHLVLGMWDGDDNMIVSEPVRITESAPEVFSTLRRKVTVKA